MTKKQICLDVLYDVLVMLGLPGLLGALGGRLYQLANEPKAISAVLLAAALIVYMLRGWKYPVLAAIMGFVAAAAGAAWVLLLVK